jgi:hypothetical protein
MTVFVLRSVFPEDKPTEATTISIYSTFDLALDAFEKEWTRWNQGLDAEDDQDMFVNIPAVVDEMKEDGVVEILSGYHSIAPYELDTHATL